MAPHPTPSGHERTNCPFLHGSILSSIWRLTTSAAFCSLWLCKSHVFKDWSLLLPLSLNHTNFSHVEPSTGHTVVAQLSIAGCLCLISSFLTHRDLHGIHLSNSKPLILIQLTAHSSPSILSCNTISSTIMKYTVLHLLLLSIELPVLHSSSLAVHSYKLKLDLIFKHSNYKACFVVDE